MSKLFDAYETNYGDTVQSAIDFSGLKHDFFLAAKADLIAAKVRERLSRRPLAALDVGCGVGALHPYLRRAFDKLQGVDVSAACVETAKQANPGVDYAIYSGTELPFEDRAFDFTLAVCVMHHVPPAQWPAFMTEMVRVTKPGGLVCIIEHNPWNPLTRLAVARCEFDRDAVLLRAGETENLMSGAGLDEPASQFFLLLPSGKSLARAMEARLAALPFGAQYMTLGARPAQANIAAGCSTTRLNSASSCAPSAPSTAR
jgi:SAM-dependent methyltransferase